MFEMFYILIAVLLVLLYFYFETCKANKCLLNLKQYIKDFQEAIEVFEKNLNGTEYFNNKKHQDWQERYKFLKEKINFDPSKTTIEKEFNKQITKFVNYYDNARKIIDNYNNDYVEKESENISSLLDKLEIKSDKEQRKAIVSEEDHTLIVAGAGTGKTQTILGKVAYLCLKKKVNPENILLLSFTRKAAEELKTRTDRISNHLVAATFNSIGYKIIGQVLGKRPDIAFEDETLYVKFINSLFNSKLKTDDEFRDVAINYFLYHLYPIELHSGFETKDEYYQSLRAGNILTIRKEKVKSIQEAMIANFFYTHKVNYEYERKYKHETSDVLHAQYKPDFYLSDYDIYLENFGIDKEGKTHFTNNEEQNKRDTLKYNADMRVKRNIHLQNKTELIEIYSYDFSEGNWQAKLTEKLSKHGVKLEKRPDEEILNEVRKGEYIRMITPLICTFLNLMKSGNYAIEDIKKKFKKKNDLRGLAFMKIYEPVYELYKNYLKEKNEIDFNDMLLKAADYIINNNYIHNYKYVIIDEFQDFSFSKYKLISAILAQNPNAKLFCVGDDWQSIYRFAGSDVNLMINFEKYFGFTRQQSLEKCHRFDNRIAEITNDFILNNKHQLNKKLYSEIQAKDDSVQIVYKTGEKEIVSLKNILEDINQNAKQKGVFINDVLLLGRFNHDKPKNIDYRLYRNIKRIKFRLFSQTCG